ncbi:MAG: hypothetical protein LBQ59_00500 [Candidatus Peribacteria bacterium]|jgi:hypothetical protein|nr:hypothetical protein [Candidatus Peribacteria bacterium]
MKIVITRRFEKEFLSKTYKYFKKEDFIDDLKFKSYKVIFLCKSFSKFKSKLNSVNFR